MKMRFILGVVLSLVVASAGYGQIANGSFEDGTCNGAFSTLAGGSTAITGWTVGAGGTVDYICSYWQASDGSRSIDMSGFFSVGSISQTFDTTPGVTYSVTFDLSGNPAGPPTTKTLVVSATGAAPEMFTYEVDDNTLTDMQWESQTYTFMATGTSTTLTFSTPDSSAFGPALDNVAINADFGTVCHRNKGKAPFKTLTIDADSVQDHLDHGDQPGPCPATNG
jgi:choice-of-anchor C domain-containing protein